MLPCTKARIFKQGLARGVSKQAMMLGGTSPSIGRDLSDEDLVKLLDNVDDIRIATLSNCYTSVAREIYPPEYGVDYGGEQHEHAQRRRQCLNVGE